MKCSTTILSLIFILPYSVFTSPIQVSGSGLAIGQSDCGDTDCPSAPGGAGGNQGVYDPSKDNPYNPGPGDDNGDDEDDGDDGDGDGDGDDVGDGGDGGGD